MKGKIMRKIEVLIFALLLFSCNSEKEVNKEVAKKEVSEVAPLIKEELVEIDPAVVEEIVSNGNELYKQLLALKKNKEFLDKGLGDPKSKQWYKRAQALADMCFSEIKKLPMKDRFDGELSSLCYAANYMHQIGLHYAKHKSKDDKFTKEVKPKIEAAFKIN